MDKKAEKTMKESVKEGGAYSVMVGFGESYINPYALYLKATTFQFGVLSSLPQLAASFFQIFTSRVTKKIGSRKTILSATVFLQAISWLPIIFLFLFPSNKILYLILFFTLYAIFGMFGNPHWRGIMGDVVPENVKGEYFAHRNKVISLTSFISLVIAGIILQFFSSTDLLTGFLLIFSVAMIARLVSWRYIDVMHDPSDGKPESDGSTFLDFVRNLSRTNAGLFVIFSCFFIFAVKIANPFFDPYMLNDLGFSYSQYMMIKSSAILGTFTFAPIWGKYSDIFGNKRVLALTGLLIVINPILWLFSKNIVYLFFINFVSGLLWAGFNLASFNFLFDALSKNGALKFNSYFNLLQGISFFLGSIFGAYVAKMGTMFWSNFYLVFIVSGVLRFVSWLVFFPLISENKYVKDTTEVGLLMTVTDSAFGGISKPFVHLIDRRTSLKYRTETMFKSIQRFLKRIFSKLDGNRYG